MTNRKIRTVAVGSLALVSIALGGCVSNPISEADRNSFDGWWTAKIQETPDPQMQNSWRLGCNNLEGEFTFEVVNGVVKMNLLGTVQESPLLQGGRFRIDQKTDIHVDESSGSDVDIDDGQVTYVIKGNLGASTPKGSIQDWVQEIGAGCITKIFYEREQG